MIRIVIPAIALILCASCQHSTVRGTFAPSPDRKTYLAVMDDNGGQCGPIKVDGKVWPYPIGETGPIDPGSHTIACGTEIGFDIPREVIFKFNYWGP